MPSDKPQRILKGRRWIIRRQDATRLLAALPASSADAVVTDPPYGIKFKQFSTGRTIRNDAGPFVWWMHEAARSLRRGGVLICFCRWDVQHAFRQAMQWAGLSVRSQVVWDKQAHGMGDTKRTFAPAHELAWFATKGDFRFPGRRPKALISTPAPHASRRLHPTEKPVPLLEQLVETTTRAGDLVVDPFSGSGSTGEAALRLGRRFIGADLEPDYVRAARARLRAIEHESMSD